MVYQETFVQRRQHRIYVRDHPGERPTIILIHGFPDNLHLYDRLIPHLSPPRRVIAFDFSGMGRSDKPAGYPYTAANQVGDLEAVMTQLRLQQVILVAHESTRVAGLVTCTGGTVHPCHANVQVASWPRPGYRGCRSIGTIDGDEPA
jgi:alpha-beta hydrolase superfamily lysophospholipase